MIGKIGTIREEAQRALLEEVEAARGNMPLVTKRMPRSGREFNYKCYSLGQFGWFSDQAKGYRYISEHPETGQRWPSVPRLLRALIVEAKALIVQLGEPGGEDFQPDSVLCNVYRPGDSLGIHIDSTEKNRAAPILSLSLGLPAKFIFGPDKRCEYKTVIRSGDVFVMAGPDRNWWHGIPEIYEEKNPLGIDYRLNLTIRQNLPISRPEYEFNPILQYIDPVDRVIDPDELPEIPRRKNGRGKASSNAAEQLELL